MDDVEHIIVRGCQIPGSARTTAGVFAPPYTSVYTSKPALVPGLGDATEGGNAWGISRNGKYIADTAPTKPTRVGVRWLNPLVP